MQPRKTVRKGRYLFTVVIEKDRDGYFVVCPALQGCYSQGNTYEEAMTNIGDAITLNIQDISQTVRRYIA
jgi:predicted RNase H-like HicB family nuclease